jgi:hypothetical protein
LPARKRCAASKWLIPNILAPVSRRCDENIGCGDTIANFGIGVLVWRYTDVPFSFAATSGTLDVTPL